MTRPAVLITGAAQRVGLVIAQYLAERGWDIALHYHHSESEAKKAQRAIGALGVECELFSQDLSELESLPKLMARAVKTFPALSALVNNASMFERGSLKESGVESYRAHFDVNFAAPALLSQAFAKACKRGNIINICDSSVVDTHSPYAYYLLSKKALAEFTRMSAMEYAPRIRVNGVCPGAVLPSSDGLWGEEYLAQREQSVPLKSLATPLAIAQAVVFLLESESITGQLIHVDGGEHLCS